MWILRQLKAIVGGMVHVLFAFGVMLKPTVVTASSTTSSTAISASLLGDLHLLKYITFFFGESCVGGREFGVVFCEGSVRFDKFLQHHCFVGGCSRKFVELAVKLLDANGDNFAQPPIQGFFLCSMRHHKLILSPSRLMFDFFFSVGGLVDRLPLVPRFGGLIKVFPWLVVVGGVV